MMSDVKWLKITTSMFDDEKIKFIDSLPDRDTIFYIWIRLIVLAGKCNAGGYIFLTEHIPYTDEMLSSVINRPLNTVKLALSTFVKLGMIDTDDKGIFLVNFSKHQNIEGLDKIKEQWRINSKKYREKRHMISYDGHPTDIDTEQDKYTAQAPDALTYLNECCERRFRPTPATLRPIIARLRDGGTVNQCERIIDVKSRNEFFVEKGYMRPSTLFRKSHWDE